MGVFAAGVIAGVIGTAVWELLPRRLTHGDGVSDAFVGSLPDPRANRRYIRGYVANASPRLLSKAGLPPDADTAWAVLEERMRKGRERGGQ